MKKIISALFLVGAVSACSSIPDISGKEADKAAAAQESTTVAAKALQETHKSSGISPDQTVSWTQHNVTAHDVFWGLKQGMEDAGFRVDESEEGETLIGSTKLAKVYGNAQFAARVVEDGENVKVVMAVTRTTDMNAKTLMNKVRKGMEENLTVKKKYKLPK